MKLRDVLKLTVDIPQIKLYLNNEKIYSGLKCYLMRAIGSEYINYDVTRMFYYKKEFIVYIMKAANDIDNIKYTNYNIGNIYYQLIEKNDKYYVIHCNNFKAVFDTREEALSYMLDFFIER